MKHPLSISGTVLILIAMVMGACSVKPEENRGMDSPTSVVKLYPEGQNTDLGIVEDGIQVTLGPGESSRLDSTEFYWDADGSLNFVSDSARLEIYLPEKRNGQMIVICPGGGYGELTYRNEGVWAAKLLTQKGYSVCVVVYRLPNGHHTVPLRDIQNAFRYCRHHAGEWGINQIGVMGLSAGGHLAACASTLYDSDITRPDFSILIYAVISSQAASRHGATFSRLTGGDEELIDFYSLDRHVTPDTPPAILFHSADDKSVKPDNSIRYYQELRKNGVRAELYIFPKGGHGWSFVTMETAGRDKLGGYRGVFFEALYTFLESIRPGSDETNDNAN